MPLWCQQAFSPLSYQDQNLISVLLHMKGFCDVTGPLEPPHTSSGRHQNTAELRLSELLTDSFALKETTVDVLLVFKLAASQWGRQPARQPHTCPNES